MTKIEHIKKRRQQAHAQLLDMKSKVEAMTRNAGGKHALGPSHEQLDAVSKNTHRIRPFRNGDGAKVYRLIQATIDACYTGIYPSRAVAFFKQHHSVSSIRKRAREGRTIVAEMNGRIVGTGTITGDHACGIFVAVEVQRLGFGRAIMTYLESLARAAGVTATTLDVSLPSRRFYERIGYRVVEVARREVGHGQTLKYWKGVKSLSTASAEESVNSVPCSREDHEYN